MSLYDTGAELPPAARRHLVVDDLDGRVVCLTSSLDVVNRLGAIYGFHAVYNLRPQRADAAFSVKDSWLWTCKVERFLPRRRRAGPRLVRAERPLSPEQLDRYTLLRERCGALQIVADDVALKRRLVWSDLPLQDFIYAAKYDEARAILGAVGPVDETRYPFVLRHADYRGCDIVAAAKEIAFEHEALKERLADTELARIVYTNRIMKAASAAELEEIIDAYQLNTPIDLPARS